MMLRKLHLVWGHQSDLQLRDMSEIYRRRLHWRVDQEIGCNWIDAIYAGRFQLSELWEEDGKTGEVIDLGTVLAIAL